MNTERSSPRMLNNERLPKGEAHDDMVMDGNSFSFDFRNSITVPPANMFDPLVQRPLKRRRQGTDSDQTIRLGATNWLEFNVGNHTQIPGASWTGENVDDAPFVGQYMDDVFDDTPSCNRAEVPSNMDLLGLWSSTSNARAFGTPNEQIPRTTIAGFAPSSCYQSQIKVEGSASTVLQGFDSSESTLPVNPIMSQQDHSRPVIMSNPCEAKVGQYQAVPPAQEMRCKEESAETNTNSIHSQELKRKAPKKAMTRLRQDQTGNWNERFEELVDFRVKNGHCLVPNAYKENLPLAEWVKRQRYQYKLRKLGQHSTMSDDRIAALEELGFVWNSHDAVWTERLKDLRAYKETFQDCNVPSNYVLNQPLAIWVKRQRRQYKSFCEGKPSTMTPYRIEKLTELGFAWSGRKSKDDLQH